MIPLWHKNKAMNQKDTLEDVKDLFYFYVYKYFAFIYVYVYEFGVCRDQKRVLDSHTWVTEVVSHHVGAGSQICRSNKSALTAESSLQPKSLFTTAHITTIRQLVKWRLNIFHCPYLSSLGVQQLTGRMGKLFFWNRR